MNFTNGTADILVLLQADYGVCFKYSCKEIAYSVNKIQLSGYYFSIQ